MACAGARETARYCQVTDAEREQEREQERDDALIHVHQRVNLQDDYFSKHTMQTRASLGVRLKGLVRECIESNKEGVHAHFRCARWNKPNFPLQIKRIQVFGPRLRETDFRCGRFRRAHRLPEIEFVNQLSILFHHCASQVFRTRVERFHKTSTTQKSFFKEECLFPGESATERGL